MKLTALWVGALSLWTASALAGNQTYFSYAQSSGIPDTPYEHIPNVSSADWRNLPPGRLVEKFAAPETSRVTPMADAYFVRYTTLNVHGELVLASGIALIPHSEFLSVHQKWPLVVYGHMTTGVADACAPSRGNKNSTELRRMQQGDKLATDLISRGVVVARPDYEGLGEDGPHPYLQGDSLAQAMRDMAQAVTGHWPSIGNKWVAAGHSEGGVAALNTGNRKHPKIPGLKLVGIASIAPVSQLDKLIGLVGPMPFKGEGIDVAIALAALAIQGVAITDPDFERLALKEGGLSAKALALWPDLDRLCLEDLSSKNSWGGLSPLQARGPKGPKLLAELQRALSKDDIRLLPMRADVPIRIDAGMTDIVASVASLNDLVKDYRKRGYSVTYRRWLADHSPVADMAAPSIAQWIINRF